MKNKAIFGLAVVVVGLFLFAGTIIHALFYYVPESEIVVADASLSNLSKIVSEPVTLEIPTIGVNAKVQLVGLTESGNMSVPHNFTDVGWYKYGTLPGNVGSAVIDGHVDNGLDLAGVFKRLKELKNGDNLNVYTKEGKSLQFVVTDVERYEYTAVPLELVFNRNDKARLNLITCDGAWIPEAKTADHRIVVYTELVQN